MRLNEREPDSQPPQTLTTILVARQTMACCWHHCITPITEGQPMILLDQGWIHALHFEQEQP